MKRTALLLAVAVLAHGEYINPAKTAKTYHAKATCIGLRSASTIVQLTSDAAVKMGRRACGVCIRKGKVAPRIIDCGSDTDCAVRNGGNGDPGGTK